MKRSTKAVLLSALVFPGAGHWYLARKWSALLLMLAAFAAFFVLMSSAWSQANLIAEQILSGELQPEIGALLDQMAVQNSANPSSSLTIATAWMGIVWCVGILDAWRVGRADPAEGT